MSSISKPKNLSQDVERHTKPLSFIERHRAASSSLQSSSDLRDPLGLNLLYEPPDSRVDLIFVHGLGGGSHKTWNISDDQDSFWPKEWLPREAGFEHARIYSFGYRSHWASKRKRAATIPDFGRALLGDICDHFAIQNGPNTYILAKQNPMYEEVSQRIRGMIFLGTPHRGADSAHRLSSLLNLAGRYGSKRFVDELAPESTILEEIEEAFASASQGLYLCSIFETVETTIGFARQMIVERRSALLVCQGLPSERIQHLNTDHRHMCKFHDPDDLNYKSLRLKILAAIRSIEKDNHPKKLTLSEQLKWISTYLNDPQYHIDELAELTGGERRRLLPAFRVWLNLPSTGNEAELPDIWNVKRSPKLFWLSGKPGTGKSMAAAHVIQYMEDNNLDCIFYFFKYGDKTKSSICNLLCSFAFQLARINTDVRQMLLDMAQNCERLNFNKPREMLESLFNPQILREKLHATYYCVIDALDECDAHSTLISLLSELAKRLPLKIFMTSRLISTIGRDLLKQSLPVFVEQMKLEDSLGDIERYLNRRTNSLPIDDESSREDLVAQILQKSNGCFLWTTLVFNLLQEAHGFGAIKACLDLVPVEMNELYEQILKKSIKISQDIILAQAVFRWVICAIRPLTSDELLEGLQHDVKDTLASRRDGIGPLCGHLVYVDENSRVQALHQTFRTFLTDKCPLAEFAIEKKQEHAHIANVCLAFLAGRDFCGSKPMDISRPPAYLSPFGKYATVHFSDHISKSSSGSDELLLSIYKFFRSSNVLAWIENLAESGNLSILTHTVKNLKSYLARRAKYLPPLGEEVQTVETWIHDLIHIGTLFSHNLLAVPKAMHFLIPPLCPRKSAIYGQFYKEEKDSFRVVGITDEDWDDRLASLLYPDEEALSLACSDNYFAVGLSDGSIFIYQSTTCEYVRKLDHLGVVAKLAFARLRPLLASCSPNKLILWNTHDGSCIWTAHRRGYLDPMALGFNNDDSAISIATKKGLSVFQVLDGKESESFSYYATEIGSSETKNPNSAWNAQFSPDLNLLTIIYRNRPIILWDVALRRTSLQIVKRGSDGVYETPNANAVVFHPNLEAHLIAVAYNDGDLVVHNFRIDQQTASFPLLAQTLAVSPDGRTLATGDTHGIIHLFNFETLRLFYRITTDTSRIQDIVFDSSCLRFLDIRDDRCNVWEPSVLVVLKESSDDTSTEPCSEEIPLPMQRKDARHWGSDFYISAIAGHQDNCHLFGGRSDGSVAVFTTETGSIVQELCSHAHSGRVHLLDWNESKSLLTSIDVSWRIICRKISRKQSGEWYTERTLLDRCTRNAILQVLTNQRGDRLLVSTTLTDIVWNLDAQCSEINRFTQQEKRQWVAHPTNPELLILIRGGKAFTFEWTQFRMTSGECGVSLESLSAVDLGFSRVISCEQANKIAAVRMSKGNNGRKSSEIQLWDAVHINSEAGGTPLCARYEHFAYDINAILGVVESSLLFLDSESWVCSVNVGNPKHERFYTRHFFIPFTWHRNKDLVYYVTASGRIAFVVGENVVVFHHGLQFKVPVPFARAESIEEVNRKEEG
uniref:Uncharacterized protein n=1 Tax=Coccidioides posadasii RMSCC 3488 TaxID=454284 RepID=A0A0J6I590_COCPO|nr:hypothetical protein CPAG_02895 [Coccidioides posadasii RMSCC 3488]